MGNTRHAHYYWGITTQAVLGFPAREYLYLNTHIQYICVCVLTYIFTAVFLFLTTYIENLYFTVIPPI